MTAGLPAATTTFPPVLRRFCMWMGALAVLSLAFEWAFWHFFHRHPQYGGTFVWSGEAPDFHVYWKPFQNFRTPGFWGSFNYPFTYPAPLGVVYWLCYRVLRVWQVYLALSLAALAGWAGMVTKQLGGRAGTFGLLLLFLAAAWPVRMLLESGNMEAAMAVLLGCGVLAAMRGRWWVAVVLIGLAASMKLYPLMLLGLPLSKRRYKEFAVGICVAVLATVASLAILGPDIATAQRHIDDGMLSLKRGYVLLPLPYGMSYSHQLFTFVKLGLMAVNRTAHPLAGVPEAAVKATRTAQEYPLMDAALRVYVPAAAVLGIALYWLRIRRLPMLNQVLALTVCSVLLPPFSQDYTLVQLLVPFGLLCVFAMQQWRSARAEPVGLAMSFAAFAFIFARNDFLYWRVSLASPMRTVALLALLIAALRYPFRMDGEPA